MEILRDITSQKNPTSLIKKTECTLFSYPICFYRASADNLWKPQVSPNLADLDSDVQNGVGAREVQEEEDRVDESLATLAAEVHPFLRTVIINVHCTLSEVPVTKHRD